MTRRRWIQDRITGELIEAELYQAPASTGPFVLGDIQPYQSMVDGQMITSRSQHRNMLRQHGLIEVGNEQKHLKSKRPEPPQGLKESIVRAVKQHRGY
jgi:hypothetical protein